MAEAVVRATVDVGDEWTSERERGMGDTVILIHVEAGAGIMAVTVDVTSYCEEALCTTDSWSSSPWGIARAARPFLFPNETGTVSAGACPRFPSPFLPPACPPCNPPSNSACLPSLLPKRQSGLSHSEPTTTSCPHASPIHCACASLPLSGLMLAETEVSPNLHPRNPELKHPFMWKHWH